MSRRICVCSSMNFRLTSLWVINNPIDLDLRAPEAVANFSPWVQFAQIQLAPPVQQNRFLTAFDSCSRFGHSFARDAASAGSVGRGAFAADGCNNLRFPPAWLDTGKPRFHCKQNPQITCKNAQNKHLKRIKNTGFSCFCMAITGRFFEKTRANPTSAV